MSASCAGNRFGSAGARAPGGGCAAAGGGAHGRVLGLAPLPLLRCAPAGSSRASAIASSGLSGAGAPGRRFVVGSTLAGTRAPFGWRPSSNRDRVSIALHSPGMRVCDVWLLSRWFWQPGQTHTISWTPAAPHSPGTLVCSGSVWMRLFLHPRQFRCVVAGYPVTGTTGESWTGIGGSSLVRI